MARGRLTDLSGTVTTGGTSQQVAVANIDRELFFLQNLSAGDLWVNFDTAAVTQQPSIKVPPGATFVAEQNFVPTGAIHIIGATTGQAFTAKEAE